VLRELSQKLVRRPRVGPPAELAVGLGEQRDALAVGAKDELDGIARAQNSPSKSSNPFCSLCASQPVLVCFSASANLPTRSASNAGTLHAVIVITRVDTRPSRLNTTSIPTRRKNDAARRKRPRASQMFTTVQPGEQLALASRPSSLADVLHALQRQIVVQGSIAAGCGWEISTHLRRV
jgi:hypothetical protein